MPTGEAACSLATRGAFLEAVPTRIPDSVTQRGYTYLLVLFLIAGLGIVAAQAGSVWQHAAQRDREADLLAIGVEFARALQSYRTASGEGVFPESLESLVEDRRGSVTVRHLRRVYRDPISGETRWGMERIGGRITGVFSLSQDKPIRRHELPHELDASATEAVKYTEWIFRPAADGGVGTASGSPNGDVSAPVLR
jgi:type II secretory pathway pseudopilin PulG